MPTTIQRRRKHHWARAAMRGILTSTGGTSSGENPSRSGGCASAWPRVVDMVTDVAAPRLRADAERNRERILAAARELFAERGLEVTLDAIAERAGLGVAT